MYQLKLNSSKCFLRPFFWAKLLGFIVSRMGTEIDLAKINIIKMTCQHPVPKRRVVVSSVGLIT